MLAALCPMDSLTRMFVAAVVQLAACLLDVLQTGLGYPPQARIVSLSPNHRPGLVTGGNSPLSYGGALSCPRYDPQGVLRDISRGE